MKDIAPSGELRKWFNHDPAKWEEFQERYRQELKSKKASLDELRQLAKRHGKLTLLYGSHDEKHNQAAVLLGELK
jgi:uncharacterized protein YeaO (DUF488 family)